MQQSEAWAYRRIFWQVDFQNDFTVDSFILRRNAVTGRILDFLGHS